jgi:Zn-finger nucleic acid-binding protein
MICQFCNSNLFKSSNKQFTIYKCNNCNVIWSDLFSAKYCILSNQTIQISKYTHLYIFSKTIKHNNSLPKFILLVYDNFEYLYSIDTSKYNYHLILNTENKNQNILSNITPSNFDKKLSTILTFL